MRRPTRDDSLDSLPKRDLLDLELHVREASWLRSRLYHDRARIFEPRTRARAMLAASAEFVSRFRASETRDIAARSAFFDLLEQVEQIARGLPIYELVDGVGYVGPHGHDDERLRRISAAAMMADLSDADLDAATVKMAAIEDAALEEGLAFVASLRAKDKPRSQPRQTRQTRQIMYEPPASRGAAQPQLRKRPDYDDTQLRAIAALLPDKVSWPARAALSERLLGDLGVTGDDAPVRCRRADRLAVLVVLLERLVEWESRVEQAVAEKAIRLSREYPRAQGTEPEYLRRASDLDAELAQELREEVARLRFALVSAAVKVSRIETWPGDRREKRYTRARRLACSVSKTTTFSREDLAMAAASLGYGDASAI